MIESKLPSAVTSGINKQNEADTMERDNVEVPRYSEYLRYGAHISHCERSIDMTLNFYSIMEEQGNCTSIRYLNKSTECALVIENCEACRMILQMLGGFQSDLFFRTDPTACGDRGSSWIRSAAAARSCVPGMSVKATQELLSWFINLADDIQYCRCISGTAVELASLPSGDKKFGIQHILGSGVLYINRVGQIIDSVNEAECVLTSALMSLYSTVHEKIDLFSGVLASEEKKIFENTGDPSLYEAVCTRNVTLISLYLFMKQWARLFAIMKSIINSTQSIFLFASEKSKVFGITRGYDGSEMHKAQDVILTGDDVAAARDTVLSSTLQL